MPITNDINTFVARAKVENDRNKFAVLREQAEQMDRDEMIDNLVGMEVKIQSLEKKNANNERIALKYENRSDDLCDEVNRLREMVKVLTLDIASERDIYETPLLLNFWDKESGEMFGDILSEMNDEDWNEDNGNCELKWSGESIGRLSAVFREDE